MVATWFSVRCCPWRRFAWLLYLYSCGTVGLPFAFRCAAGVIGSVSSGMMWGACWGGRLGACPGFKDMLFVGPPSEVAQRMILELLMGYPSL